MEPIKDKKMDFTAHLQQNVTKRCSPHVTDPTHLGVRRIATSSESSDHITAIRLNTQHPGMEIAG